MLYDIILMGCDTAIRSRIDRAIKTSDLNYRVIGSFVNPLDAMGFITQLNPHIIICSDVMQYLYVDQFIANISKRMPELQFIVIEYSEDGAKRNLLRHPQIAEIISAEDASEEIFQTTLKNAVEKWHDQQVPIVPKAKQAYNPEIDDLITQIVEQKKFLEVHYIQLPFLVTGGWVGVIVPVTNGEQNSSFSTMRRVTELLYEQIDMTLRSAAYLHTFSLTNRSVSFVFDSSITSFSLVRNLLGRIFSAVNQQLQHLGMSPVAVFLGETQVFGNNFNAEYEAVGKRTQYSFFGYTDQIMTQSVIEEHNKLFDSHGAEEFFSRLEKAVVAMDVDGALHIIDEIQDSIRQTMSFAFVRYAQTQFEFILNMQLRHLDADPEQSLLKANSRPPKTDIFRLCTYYKELFKLLIQHMRDSNEHYANPYINHAIQYICSHLEESTSLTEVAEAIHISPSYLSHLFIDVTGKTFSNMNNAVRIGQAKKLLSMGVPVSRVAEKTGYQSDKYFGRVFKAAVGISPRKYLELCKKQEEAHTDEVIQTQPGGQSGPAE